MYIYTGDEIDNLDEISILDLCRIRCKIDNVIKHRMRKDRDDTMERTISDPKVEIYIPARVRDAVINEWGDITLRELIGLSYNKLMNLHGVGEATIKVLTERLIYSLDVPVEEIKFLK